MGIQGVVYILGFREFGEFSGAGRFVASGIGNPKPKP